MNDWAFNVLPQQSGQTQMPVPPFGSLTMMVFGMPGVGKTTFCTGADDVLLIATEPGYEFVKANVVDLDKMASIANQQLAESLGISTNMIDPRQVTKPWHVFKQLVAEINTAKKNGVCPYKSVVIDIIDNLHAHCLTSVCNAKGLQYPPENDFGKTWNEINKEWQKWLRALMQIVNVRFVTHCTERKVKITLDNGMSQEIDRLVPTFSGNKAAQYLDGVVNAVGYCTQKGNGDRLIVFKQRADLGAKDRTNILETLGELPLNWEQVNKAYADKAKEMGFFIR